MKLVRTLMAALGASLMLVGQGFAQSALDSRFTDADGDLVADVPTDASQLIDPDTLIFAYTPVEDPALYREIWAEFLEHLESVTGKPVEFFPVGSYAAQVEAMRAGRLHVAGISTGPTPLGVNCAGYVPFAIMGADDGSFGYEMEIISYPGSGIETVEDIKGKKLAFTQETSNSGFKAPSALLGSEFGMEAGTDYEPVFSGSHDTSVIGVANKDYPAAAIANEVMHRMFERDVVQEDQIVTVYKSQTFPTTGYGVVYNLEPELQDKIKEAFFSFAWEGTALQEEFSEAGMDKFIEITFEDDWSVIRQIDEAMGVSYACQ